MLFNIKWLEDGIIHRGISCNSYPEDGYIICWDKITKDGSIIYSDKMPGIDIFKYEIMPPYDKELTCPLCKLKEGIV